MIRIGKYKAAILLTVLIAVLFGFQVKSDFSSGNTVDLANESLNKLLSFGKAVSGEPNEPMKVIVKWHGYWDNTKLSLDEAASKMTMELGLPKAKHTSVQNRDVFTSSDEQEGAQVHFSIVEQTSHHYYTVIQIEASNDINSVNQLYSLQHGLGEKLTELGVSAEWNGAIQGMVNGEDVEESIDKVEQTLETSVRLKKKESYSDISTISRSYDSSSLPIRVKSGQHNVSLQIAAHQIEGTHTVRITIGMPLITIEY
ncbi:YwmB family TATA-box binding protein [Paenibacillus sediminis]|uniref:Ribosome-associated translation inhibitor RaiA n=1 Tax=Paenibacillus sediminis TaxID=664909 RepID=A0ABS4H7I4_9BACL|nr:YwmB family TATA-box binding protein [Paenibacillus sediminis]MBP1938484.1 ribosome-associated translation inhibitor RaiA [Paenibacillus sediminis]